MHELTGTNAAKRTSGSGHEKMADAGLAASNSGGRTTACDPHALGGAQCGEQRDGTTTTRAFLAQSRPGR